MSEYSVRITSNLDEIKSVLSQDYDSLVYDNSPAIQEFNATGVWFILYYKTEIAGFITVSPLNNVTWMPHILIYKQFRGPESKQWGQQVYQIMRECFKAEKFLAFTPYISAKKLAENIGFKCIAILTSSIKKNGKLLDQYILEMN